MWKAQDIAKKQHRERSQPQARQKWGLLEKKKDYRLRAADYHKKQAHLELLRTKAANSHEDEFNFGMIKARTKEGVLQKSRGAEELSNDAVKLLKTQDTGYLRTLIGNEQRKIDKSRAGMAMGGTGSHTLFLEDEKTMKNFDAAQHFDTPKALVGRRENRLRNSQITDIDAVDADRQEQQLKELETLSKRVDRRNELAKVQQELELQRELMKKGDKKKLVDKNGNVSYKWKKVRKR